MKTTQNNKLVSLMRHRFVTPLLAYAACGTLRFSGRILEIKRAGHKLESRWIETPSGARVKAFRIAA